MRLKEYYMKNTQGHENDYEYEYNVIADYLSSFEMNQEDIKTLHSLNYSADDFLDNDLTEKEFYANNDLFLLIDYFYDVYGFMFTSKIRNFTKEDLKDKYNMLNNASNALKHIIENYAD